MGGTVLAILGWPSVVGAQGLRGTATTTTRYVQLRPLQLDTVARDQVTQLPDGSLVYQGQPVNCLSNQACTFYRPANIAHAFAFTQDVGFTAWGLGMRGLSATVSLRARADLGGQFPWPRSEDNFDAMLAYLELNRRFYRVRLGRQQNLSELGFSGYDGASILVTPSIFTLEAYGGRSLARGLNEPANEALKGIEDFVVDQQVYLLGGAVGIEPTPGTSLEARYQREIYANGLALVSERASVVGRSDLLRPVQVDGAFDYDFAFGQVGKAHLTVGFPLGARRQLMVQLTGRRYLPYFDLSTIWGYFSPVAYREGELRVNWTASRTVNVWASGAWRRYGETNAPIILTPLKQETVRGSLGATVRPAAGWLLDGTYTQERGFGASLSSGDMAVRWRPTDRLSLTADGTAFQQIEEFRVGQGLVYGGGLSADLTVFRDVGLSGGMNVYRQTFKNTATAADWDQVRGWAGLRIGFGEDPGIRWRGRGP